MNAYTDADVAALTSVTCHTHHGLGAPEQPCFGCRSDAARLLDAVASGIAARAKAGAERQARVAERALSDAMTALDQIADTIGLGSADLDAFFLIEELPTAVASAIRADQIERAS